AGVDQCFGGAGDVTDAGLQRVLLGGAAGEGGGVHLQRLHQLVQRAEHITGTGRAGAELVASGRRAFDAHTQPSEDDVFAAGVVAGADHRVAGVDDFVGVGG